MYPFVWHACRGIWVVCATTLGGWILLLSILGPLLITMLLLCVSGIPILERQVFSPLCLFFFLVFFFFLRCTFFPCVSFVFGLVFFARSLSLPLLRCCCSVSAAFLFYTTRFFFLLSFGAFLFFVIVVLSELALWSQNFTHCPVIETGWRRLVGTPKLQIILRKRATKCRSLLWKMTFKDKRSYESSPPCNRMHGLFDRIHACSRQNIRLFDRMKGRPRCAPELWALTHDV